MSAFQFHRIEVVFYVAVPNGQPLAYGEWAAAIHQTILSHPLPPGTGVSIPEVTAAPAGLGSVVPIRGT